MTAEKLREIQKAVFERVETKPDLGKAAKRHHSPTLWLALEVIGFDLADLAARSVPNIERLASTHLRISRTHCALIRMADWYDLWGGIPYLDFNLPQLGPAAENLRNFWFHLDTLTYDDWRGIKQKVADAPAEWVRGWVRAAHSASVAAPETFYLAGEAAIEVSHEPALDIIESCARAKHRATIEIIAASNTEDIPLNYLWAFGFLSLDDIPEHPDPK